MIKLYSSFAFSDVPLKFLSWGRQNPLAEYKIRLLKAATVFFFYLKKRQSFSYVKEVHTEVAEIIQIYLYGEKQN